MSYICPRCGSDHITTHQNIYENGTSNIKTSSFGSGAGFGTGGVGAIFGSTSTSGKSQSISAKKYAPPENGSLIKIIFAIILLIPFTGILGRFDFGIFALGAAFFGSIIYIQMKKRLKYPDLLNIYIHSWHCNKCGNDFNLKNQT